MNNQISGPQTRVDTMLFRKKLNAALIAALTAGAMALTSLPPALAAGGDIKVIVNKVPITALDISRRVAFLKLQRKKGNLQSIATEEMIDEQLKRAEMRRVGISVPDKQVEEAYLRFASGNKLKPAQLDQILNQSGVTPKHFKDYIRMQISWGQTVSSRYRATTGRVSEQEAVRKMMEKGGGTKPSATEYLLQQVIFVVPAAKRGAILGSRKREAESMRARYNGCEGTVAFAKGLKDVTVRNLGRVLAPELPPDWAEFIKKTSEGNATPVRETDRGIEFIGICRAREVSDDKVSQLLFQSEGGAEKQASELDKKYVQELREKAQIVKR
jgi:peptidyl-prolyl cis-trans isomerase SurA